MPYCKKCGAKLSDDARFCPSCGTPIAPLVTERERRPPKRAPIIHWIVPVLIAVIIIAFLFLPIRRVDITESGIVPHQPNVEAVDIDLTADIGRVKVAFVPLAGKLAALDVSVKGHVGFLAPTDLLSLTFDYTTVGKVTTATADVDIVSRLAIGMNVTCDLRIDPSMNTSLKIETSTGAIYVTTRTDVVINSMNLETSTGKIQVDIVEDTVVTGNVFVVTSTGAIDFSWENVVVHENIDVTLHASTGGINIGVKQDERLEGNVKIDASCSTGGIDFAIDIQGEIGAEIQSSTSFGGIDIKRQIGFSGAETSLQSNNYPARNNFDVSLSTSTGGIDIDVQYTV